jgi:hypothetical protein
MSQSATLGVLIHCLKTLKGWSPAFMLLQRLILGKASGILKPCGLARVEAAWALRSYQRKLAGKYSLINSS